MWILKYHFFATSCSWRSRKHSDWMTIKGFLCCLGQEYWYDNLEVNFNPVFSVPSLFENFALSLFLGLFLVFLFRILSLSLFRSWWTFERGCRGSTGCPQVWAQLWTLKLLKHYTSDTCASSFLCSKGFLYRGSVCLQKYIQGVFYTGPLLKS